MENQFIRHEPCFERILFVLTLDRKKMKKRIMAGTEPAVRSCLSGNTKGNTGTAAPHVAAL